MATIEYSDGTKIEFSGAPTQQDAEDAYNQVKGIAPVQAPATTPTPEPNYAQRVGGAYGEAAKSIISDVEQGANALQEGTQKGGVAGAAEAVGGLARTGLRTTGTVAGAAFAPLTEFPGVKQTLGFLGKGIQKLSETAPIKAAGDLFSPLAQLVIDHPEESKDAQAILNIVSLGGGKVAEAPIAGEVKALSQDVSTLAKNAFTPTEEATQAKIQSLFQKSIKPTAKKTLAQGERYQNDTLNALKTIKENAPSLNIQDATGELISGRTPQTINELSQGLDQTKYIVFKQYDALAKEAGSAGAIIDTKTAADAVLDVSKNKALQITNPEIVKYAENWSERLKRAGTLDPETTQEIIKNVNQNLQAFYRNPTYESASKAAIDAGVVNNLRQALDKSIEGATGKQYQAVKNQYGALKSIENDVTRAAARDARKNVKGLLDYSDIFTGGQMLGGIMSLNPAMFTKGAIERGIKEYIKVLNDPNRAVKNIFDQLDKTAPTTFVPKSGTVKTVVNTAEAIKKTARTIKETPNKSGGFVSIGGKTTKEVTDATKKEMVQLIDYLNLKKPFSNSMEASLSKITEKYGINPDWSSSKIADKLSDLVEQTKTK